MLTLGIFGVIVGAILGARFRVLVLAPVIFFAAATIIAAGFVSGFGVGLSLVALLVILTSLEFGYLAGTALERPIFSAESNCDTLPGCLLTESPSQCLQWPSFSLLYFMNSTAATTPSERWRRPTFRYRLLVATLRRERCTQTRAALRAELLVLAWRQLAAASGRQCE